VRQQQRVLAEVNCAKRQRHDLSQLKVLKAEIDAEEQRQQYVRLRKEVGCGH
jgi:hypothetical protein